MRSDERDLAPGPGGCHRAVCTAALVLENRGPAFLKAAARRVCFLNDKRIQLRAGESWKAKDSRGQAQDDVTGRVFAKLTSSDTNKRVVLELFTPKGSQPASHPGERAAGTSASDSQRSG